MHKLINVISLPSIILSLVISILSPSAFAVETSPYIVLETVGTNLFKRIADNQQEIKKFPDVMRTIVDEELMPSIDYKYAAYRILGKKLAKTSKQQRAKFVDSMRNYLVRTYATALKQYNNQQVIFEPSKPTNGKRIVSISTKIIDSSRPTINIEFKMRQNKKTKQWKAFDMVVEGISLLSSKQAELSKRIAKRGVDQVTLELASITK